MSTLRSMHPDATREGVPWEEYLCPDAGEPAPPDPQLPADSGWFLSSISSSRGECWYHCVALIFGCHVDFIKRTIMVVARQHFSLPALSGPESGAAAAAAANHLDPARADTRAVLQIVGWREGQWAEAAERDADAESDGDRSSARAACLDLLDKHINCDSVRDPSQYGGWNEAQILAFAPEFEGVQVFSIRLTSPPQDPPSHSVTALGSHPRPPVAAAFQALVRGNHYSLLYRKDELCDTPAQFRFHTASSPHASPKNVCRALNAAWAEPDDSPAGAAPDTPIIVGDSESERRSHVEAARPCEPAQKNPPSDRAVAPAHLAAASESGAAIATLLPSSAAPAAGFPASVSARSDAAAAPSVRPESDSPTQSDAAAARQPDDKRDADHEPTHESRGPSVTDRGARAEAEPDDGGDERKGQDQDEGHSDGGSRSGEGRRSKREQQQQEEEEETEEHKSARTGSSVDPPQRPHSPADCVSTVEGFLHAAVWHNKLLQNNDLLALGDSVLLAKLSTHHRKDRVVPLDTVFATLPLAPILEPIPTFRAQPFASGSDSGQSPIPQLEAQSSHPTHRS
jgi:hypothetical protein